MSQPPSAGPARRRPSYTARACNSCRRRRRKCDGVQPVCGTCTSSGHQCSWGPEDDDGRDRSATKQYIESLRVKIQMLESEISRLRLAESSAAQPSPALDHSVLGSAPPVPDDPQHTTVEPSPPSQHPSMVYQYIFNIDTSLSFETQTAETQASLVCAWDSHLPRVAGTGLSRHEHDTVLARCFQYGPTWLLGIVPQLFLRDMLHSKTIPSVQTTFQHYCPMLHCSLLALATAFSDNPQIRAPATRSQFAAQARQSLEDNIGHTSPSFGVALALLSEYHRGMGDRSIAYFYLGMSAHLVHNPFKPPGSAGNSYSWSVFVQDKLMAFENEVQSDMRAPLPTTTELQDGLEVASHFGDPNNDKSVLECFAQICKLMLIATPVINNIGKPRTALGTVDTKYIHFVSQLDASDAILSSPQLKTWLENLPEDLFVRADLESTLPRVLCLHLCYWWITLESNMSPAHGPPEPSEQAAGICARAASQIIDLVTLFSTQHGLQFFPRTALQAVYKCGRALIIAGEWDGAGTCMDALHALASTWPWAAKLAVGLEEELENNYNPVTDT